MCGIVGYVGQRPVQEILLAGLEKLEYRGYDSAGVSVLADGEIGSVRAVGNLSKLRAAVLHSNGGAAEPDAAPVATIARPSTCGIGHTRWATHGRVTESNAHPHFDTADRVHVVVNGIVENYLALKRRLEDMGADFTSETDAEVIAHLISHHMARGSLVEAVLRRLRRARGPLRVRRDERRRARHARRRAQGLPADRRPRRRRAVPRLGRSRRSSPTRATCSSSTTTRSSSSGPAASSC